MRVLQVGANRRTRKGKSRRLIFKHVLLRNKIVNYSTQLTTVVLKHETGLNWLLCLKPDKAHERDELTDS